MAIGYSGTSYRLLRDNPIAVANTGSESISIFLGLGNGAFAAPLDFKVGNAPDWITIADLNGDGRPDLLVANAGSNTVSVLLNGQNVVGPISLSSVPSFQAGPVAPGKLVTVFGSNLGPNPPDGPVLNSSGLVSTQLAQTQVLFDGVPAPLTCTGPGQVSAVVFHSVADQGSTQ